MEKSNNQVIEKKIFTWDIEIFSDINEPQTSAKRNETITLLSFNVRL